MLVDDVFYSPTEAANQESEDAAALFPSEKLYQIPGGQFNYKDPLNTTLTRDDVSGATPAVLGGGTSTLTGRTKERAGTTYYQVYTPFTAADDAAFEAMHGMPRPPEDKQGLARYVPEYSLGEFGLSPPTTTETQYSLAPSEEETIDDAEPMLRPFMRAVSSIFTPQKGAEDAMNSLSFGSDVTRTLGYGFILTDQIESMAKNSFEGMGKDGGNPLTDYITAKEKEQAQARHHIRKGEKLFEDWGDLSGTEADALDSVILESSAAQVDPSDTWDSKRNTQTSKKSRFKAARKRTHQRLREQYQALSPKAQYIFNAARDYYAATHQEFFNQTIDNVLESYDVIGSPNIRKRLRAATTVAEVEAIPAPFVSRRGKDGAVSIVPLPSWKKITSTLGGLAKLRSQNGPYFPAMRFGEYAAEYKKTQRHDSVYASRDAARVAANKVRGDDAWVKVSAPIEVQGGWTFDETTSGFSLYETPRERDTAVAKLRASGFTANGSKKEKIRMPSGDSAAQLLAVIARKHRGENREATLAPIREALVSMMPESAMQKRLMRKKNVPGASLDARRSFAAYNRSSAWSLAHLKNYHAVTNSYVDMVRAPKEAARNGEPQKVIDEMGRVAEEMGSRFNAAKEEGGALSRAISIAGFFNFLYTLSHSVLNSTQVLALALPQLGGRYGAAKAMGAITAAYTEAVPDAGGTALYSALGLRSLLGKSAHLNTVVDKIIARVAKNSQEDADALSWLADNGHIEATFVTGITEMALGGTQGMLRNVLEMGRTLPFLVEVVNRSVSGLAAYRLARADGNSIDEARQIAAHTVKKTQFNYTNFNRARQLNRSDVTRVMSMYKVYPMGVGGFYVGHIANTINSRKSKRERVIAAKTIALSLGVISAFTGAAGGILVEPIRIAMMALLALWPEDDDSWIKNFLEEPTYELRKLIFETTGSKKVAEVATEGLPRLVGADMRGRMGYDQLFIRINKKDTALGTFGASLGNFIFGPVWGYVDGMQRAAAYVEQGGGAMGAFQRVSPKIVRDAMKSSQLGSEGLTDFKGRQIRPPEDFSAAERVVKAVGFATATEADTYAARGHQQALRVRFSNRQKALLSMYARADQSELAAIRRERKAFNRSLPSALRRENRITSAMELRARRNFKMRERSTVKGVSITKRNRGQLRELEMFR